MYRVCKIIEIEAAHRLMQHAGNCRYIHGHTRKVEVTVASSELDANRMVIDFAAVKAILKAVLDKYDHALYLNSRDTATIKGLAHLEERILILENTDPTTEVLAKKMFDEISAYLRTHPDITLPNGQQHRINRSVTLQRVRIWETSTSWAEYEASGEGETI